jgi:hypothetical protein
VVVVNVKGDGVPEPSVRAVATSILDPLGRCYASYVSALAELAPQGPVILSARLGDDGSVVDADAEAARALPQPLVDCAMDALKAQRFATPYADLATVEMELWFVYRILPRRIVPKVE